MEPLRGLCVGTGYFSSFHIDAWQRIEGVEIVGLCDLDAAKAAEAATRWGVTEHGTDIAAMIERLQPDFIDLITPPSTHLDLVRAAAGGGRAIMCQKPLAPTVEEAQAIVATARDAGARLMVHENFRFQPWHREIKRLIDAGAIGDRLHTLTFRSRMGDGWGEDAYLGRQPYFRTMPRLLVYETGVHYIDTFRYLAGEIAGVYAVLRKLNPVIAGEDAGLLLFEFGSGAVGVWDANRYNECNDPDPRYTFGEFLVEGSGGSIRLYLDGRITLQRLGEPEQDVPYPHERRGFAGDCCYYALKHFAEALRTGGPFETDGEDYLKTLAVQEALYESAARGAPIRNLGAP